MCVLLVDVARAAGPRCVTDRDCDDGVFCNGVERCAGKEKARADALLRPTGSAPSGKCRAAARAACVLPGSGPMFCEELRQRCIAIVGCGWAHTSEGA